MRFIVRRTVVLDAYLRCVLPKLLECFETIPVHRTELCQGFIDLILNRRRLNIFNDQFIKISGPIKFKLKFTKIMGSMRKTY